MGCGLLLIPALKLPAVTNHYENGSGGLERRGKEISLRGKSFSSFPILSPKVNNGIRRRSFYKCQSQLQMAELATPTAVTYGAILLAGGVFAFSKSNSKGSLYGGLTGATLMAVAYFLMQSQETTAAGDALGFGSAFLFSSVFGIRLVASRKLIPSGLLLGLSLCALTVFLSSYFQLQDSL